MLLTTMGELRNVLAGFRLPELERLHRAPEDREVAVEARAELRPRGQCGVLVVRCEVLPRRGKKGGEDVAV